MRRVLAWAILLCGCDVNEPVPLNGWMAVYDGLSQGAGEIPRQGLANATLERALGVAVEPFGAEQTFEGQTFVAGKVSHFGGPEDSGIPPDGTGAITGELISQLNDPLMPSEAQLETRPQDFYYAAMRFDYSFADRSFWRDARLLLINPQTAQAVIVRPVDWGPNTSTGRVIDLSPQAIADLGLVTDETALIAFAVAGAELGVLR